MPARPVVSLWRRLPFTYRFLIILGVTALLIAAVPLIIAARETKGAAQARAADRVNTASQLVTNQQASITAYVGAVSANLVNGNAVTDPSGLREALLSDSKANPGDTIGVLTTSGVVAARNGALLDPSDDLVQRAIAGIRHDDSLTTDGAGHAVFLAASPVPGSSAQAFIARAIQQSFLEDVVLVRDGKVAADGTIVGQKYSAGTAVPAGVLAAIASGGDPQSESISNQDVAVATKPLAGGFTLVSTSLVTTTVSLGVPELILLVLVLVAMVFIITIVQSDLQRPLRRLDRAVAALGRGELDVAVPEMSTGDEIGRLAANFEVMRRQLRGMLQGTRARVAIATELNAAQPLQTALEKVCTELRAATDADAALIVVGGSEMTDSFVVGTGRSGDLDAGALLTGTGPLGSAFRSDSGEAITASALPGSLEAKSGLTTLCIAPLRMGDTRLGAVAISYDGATPDAALVTSTAEQVALALERYRFLAVVQRQASIDDLTGLSNHRFLVDHIDQQVALAERLGAPLAVLMLDIDHFKRLNDTHGHHAGDVALQVFAETLSGSIRRSDLAARYGGEEFAVIMPNTRRADAARVAEKIRAAVEAEEVVVDSHGKALKITVSIGVATFPTDTDTAEDLLKRADEALYVAKRGGRNRVALLPLQERRSGPRRGLDTDSDITATADDSAPVVNPSPTRSPQR